MLKYIESVQSYKSDCHNCLRSASLNNECCNVLASITAACQLQSCARLVLVIGDREDLLYSHLGDRVNAAESWVPVLHFETFTAEGVVLHTTVVIGTDGIEVGSLSKLLELLWCLV